MKKNKVRLEHCIRNDNQLLVERIAGNRTPFLHRCHAGASELVVPLFNEEQELEVVLLGIFREEGARCPYRSLELLHEDIPPVIDEAAQAMGGDVKTAEYALPGTKELAQNALAALGNGAACLLANHGAVCVGKDANAAFKVCNVLEMTAHIYYRARSIGEPEPISRENVEYMRDFAANRYGQDKN